MKVTILSHFTGDKMRGTVIQDRTQPGGWVRAWITVPLILVILVTASTLSGLLNGLFVHEGSWTVSSIESSSHKGFW